MTGDHDPTTKQVELFIVAGRPGSALCVALAERAMRLPWGRIALALALVLGPPAALVHFGTWGRSSPTTSAHQETAKPTLPPR